MSEPAHYRFQVDQDVIVEGHVDVRQADDSGEWVARVPGDVDHAREARGNTRAQAVFRHITTRLIEEGR